MAASSYLGALVIRSDRNFLRNPLRSNKWMHPANLANSGVMIELPGPKKMKRTTCLETLDASRHLRL